MNHDNDTRHLDAAAFDDRMRQRYTLAVEQVSPRVRAQLHQRRHAALATGRRHAPSWLQRHAWAGAASFAALLAVAVGVQQFRPAGPAPAAHAVQVAAVDIDATGDASPAGSLDENPDFYVWLASSDANAFAME